MVSILNRTFLFLYGVSSFLFIPLHLSNSASLQPLLFITALAATASPAYGYALPEKKQADFLPAVEKRNDDYSTPCVSEEQAATATVGSLDDPVTITITVFVPPGGNFSTAITVPHPTSTESPSETNTSYPSGNSTGYSYGSGVSTTTTPATTRTTSTPSPSATVDPVLASAQQAQRLNVAFQSIKISDSCTAGERACIGTQIAQCSTPTSSSESPRWVAQACNPTTDRATVCAAVPDTSSSGTQTNATTTAGLGCFTLEDIAARFSSAGADGGMFPPGFQSSTSWAPKQHVTSVALVLAFSAVMASLM